jgi:glycerol-3-phosphate dehydrogenase
MSGNDIYDVAVIGAGVVGCATARRFALAGLRVLLLERGADILSGASKANSAILHTGFDAPTGSLELECMQAGYDEYLAIREARNLPLLETGALVVAWSETDEAKLESLEAQAHANGVMDAHRIGRMSVRTLEPGLAESALAALRVPREYLIDPWSPFLAYVIEAQSLGARIERGCEVIKGDFDGKLWWIETSRGRFMSRWIVNAAGLYGDTIETAFLGDATFTIKPRKGQFVVFDKAASKLLGAIILPVPSERTKGLVLTRTIFGNVLVGPTAEEQEERTRSTVTTPELEMLVHRATEILPALEGMPVTATYAGLRPATEEKHYRIRHEPEQHWITAGGIRSTGMTSALGLAQHLLKLYGGEATATPVAPKMANLAEHLSRDYQSPGYGEIVCHCEMVTRREIDAALEGPLPPGDFGGLKRRTRCGMGRCQGFYCNGRLAELTRGRFAEPLAVP